MRLAYVDTSCLVAISLDEPGASTLAVRLESFERLVSSGLLEAEYLATLAREKAPAEGSEILTELSWVHPDRPLTEEIRRVLGHGTLRGADLWHLACALYLAGEPELITFATLDERQRRVASELGFEIL